MGSDAHYSVDFGHFIKDIITVALCEASRNDDLEFWILFPCPDGIEDVLYCLLLGRVDESACVYDADISLGHVRRRHVAFFQKHVGDHVAVHLILRASQ